MGEGTPHACLVASVPFFLGAGQDVASQGINRPESAPICVIRTVLFSDLVGSTSLVVSLGDRLSSELWARHDRIARDLLPQFAGKEIDKSDGFFMLFDRPIDAVGYALAYHDKLVELSKGFGVAIGARVGMHMGEVLLRVNEDGDVARGAKCLEVTGLAVPTAARVMSLASKGQTLLTGPTFDLARRAVVGEDTIPSEICWMNHGLYEFKGLDGAVPVCEVGRARVAPLAPPPDSAKATRCVDPSPTQTGAWRPAPRQVVPGSGGWKLQRRLGQGGIGEVWLVRHSKQRTARAFKFWFNGDGRRAPKQEMVLCQLLGQQLGIRPDIIRVYGHRIDHSPYFLEMEYLREGNLVEWSERQGGIAQIPLDVRLELVAQVAVALKAAHSVGVIHKDVKPTNVLIRQQENDAPCACLTDFGIGQLVILQSFQADRGNAPCGTTGDFANFAGTTTGAGVGTRLYMPPEYMVKGASIGHQSDIYSLGVLLFQMIVGDLGRPLVHGWQKSVDDELLRAAVEDCIAELPEDRLEHADVLAERLRSIGVRRRALVVGSRRLRGWKRVGFSIKILIVAAVLVAHVAVGVMLGSRREQDARSKAQAILTRFGSAPDVALEATKNISDRERRYFGEAVVYRLFSSAAVERVSAARAALWGDESVEAAFWASSNGGPIWEHGDWMQVCAARFLDPVPLIPKLAAKAKQGTDREKFIAYCLLGDLAEPGDQLAQACSLAADTESHPGVIAAAHWAAGRLGQSRPLRTRDARPDVEPRGMLLVPISGLRAIGETDSSPAPRTLASRVIQATPGAPAFHMSATIVTWEQLAPFLLTARGGDSAFDTLLNRLSQRLEDFEGERYAYAPASGIPPVVAKAFCEWLTRRARQAGQTTTYRLPTLAEWQFVYRDGDRHAYHCLDIPKSPKGALDGGSEAGRESFRVASNMPNYFGVFDTHGDIEELCTFSESGKAPSLPEQWTDSGQSNRHTTGDYSTAGPIGICRQVDRADSTSVSSPPSLGFRVVRVP